VGHTKLGNRPREVKPKNTNLGKNFGVKLPGENLTPQQEGSLPRIKKVCPQRVPKNPVERRGGAETYTGQ